MVRERKVLVGRITLSEACEQVRAKEQAASAKATDALGLVRLSPTTSAVGPARAAQSALFILRRSARRRCSGALVATGTCPVLQAASSGAFAGLSVLLWAR